MPCDVLYVRQHGILFLLIKEWFDSLEDAFFCFLAVWCDY